MTGATVHLTGAASTAPSGRDAHLRLDSDLRHPGDPVRPDGRLADVHRPGDGRNPWPSAWWSPTASRPRPTTPWSSPCPCRGPRRERRARRRRRDRGDRASDRRGLLGAVGTSAELRLDPGVWHLGDPVRPDRRLADVRRPEHAGSPGLQPGRLRRSCDLARRHGGYHRYRSQSGSERPGYRLVAERVRPARVPARPSTAWSTAIRATTPVNGSPKAAAPARGCDSTWASPVTLSHVVLHDRPNSNDQITAAHLIFSDGSFVPVGALPNAGAALTVDVPRQDGHLGRTGQSTP